jgi:hypothetical protein
MATRLAKTDMATNPGDRVPPLPQVPLLPQKPQTVTVEAVVSHNHHLVGDQWELPLNDATLALIDLGWVIVIGVDGFVLPEPL